MRREEFLTPKELALVACVSKPTLTKWAQKGIGPKRFRIGNGIRYFKKDVEAWLAQATGEKNNV